MADRELLLERLERLAIVLDEMMPKCAELVRDAIALLKEQEAVVRCKMTNQEWLGTLSPETWWEVVLEYVIHNYGARFTDTRLAVIDWLKQEHEPIKVLDSIELIMPRKEQ